MNRKSLFLINDQIRKTKLNNFRIEDILFTGILREKAGITNVQTFLKTVFAFHKFPSSDELLQGKETNH